MVYAAGFGTRMGELTRELPKSLLLVAGETLLDRALDIVVRGGLSGAVVNLHYRGSLIRDHLKSRTMPKITFSDEHDRILETGGGLKRALGFFQNQAVCTLNSDAYWKNTNPLLQLRMAWDPGMMDALLLLMPISRMPKGSRKGDFVLTADGRLNWPKSGEDSLYMFTGAQVIKTAIYQTWPSEEFSNLDVWRRIISIRRCFGLVMDGDWVDVGHPEAITEAEALERK